MREGEKGDEGRRNGERERDLGRIEREGEEEREEE